MSATPAISCSPLSMTPVINPSHGFSVIAGVVDNGDKYIAGDNDAGDQGMTCLWTRLFMAVQINYLQLWLTSAAGDSAVLVSSSFGGLRGLKSGCVRCL